MKLKTKNFGKLVKTYRVRQGWTQAQLARKAKVAQPYIFEIEKNVCSNPTVKTIFKLSKALRIHPLALFSSFY